MKQTQSIRELLLVSVKAAEVSDPNCSVLCCVEITHQAQRRAVLNDLGNEYKNGEEMKNVWAWPRISRGMVYICLIIPVQAHCENLSWKGLWLLAKQKDMSWVKGWFSRTAKSHVELVFT